MLADAPPDSLAAFELAIALIEVCAGRALSPREIAAELGRLALVSLGDEALPRVLGRGH